MPDRISTYRQIRLVMQVPMSREYRSYFSVHAVGVRCGIPTSHILADGFVGNLPRECTEAEIVEALRAAVAQLVP